MSVLGFFLLRCHDSPRAAPLAHVYVTAKLSVHRYSQCLILTSVSTYALLPTSCLVFVIPLYPTPS